MNQMPQPGAIVRLMRYNGVVQHATLMMVIRQLYDLNVDKVTAKEIAERELARYYTGYR